MWTAKTVNSINAKAEIFKRWFPQQEKCYMSNFKLKTENSFSDTASKFPWESFQTTIYTQWLYMWTYHKVNHILLLELLLKCQYFQFKKKTEMWLCQLEVTEWFICHRALSRSKSSLLCSHFSPADNQALRGMPHVISRTWFICLSLHHKEETFQTSTHKFHSSCFPNFDYT